MFLILKTQVEALKKLCSKSFNGIKQTSVYECPPNNLKMLKQIRTDEVTSCSSLKRLAMPGGKSFFINNQENKL